MSHISAPLVATAPMFFWMTVLTFRNKMIATGLWRFLGLPCRSAGRRRRRLSLFRLQYPDLRAFIIILLTLIAALPVKAAMLSNNTSIASAARAQIGKTLSYDPGYRPLDYPNGDVPIETGVCADVVVRALRQSLGLDLQKLVHDDMKRNFSQYPQNWGLKAPDKNIDHRRVAQLPTYLKQRGGGAPPPCVHQELFTLGPVTLMLSSHPSCP